MADDMPAGRLAQLLGGTPRLIFPGFFEREKAQEPRLGPERTKVSTFAQELFDEAKKDGRIVIRMKDDWKRIFEFESLP